MTDRAGFALFIAALLSFAACSASQRAPLYPVADVACVVSAEAAGMSEAEASSVCGLAVAVVHDIVGQHRAAVSKLPAKPSAPCASVSSR